MGFGDMFGLKSKKQEQTLALEEAESKPLKYELLPVEDVFAPNGYNYPVHRIRALVDIPLHGVRAGDLGGFVYNESVLSHEGSCWIGGDALAMSVDMGRVSVVDDALIMDKAFTWGIIGGKAVVSGNAIVQTDLSHNSRISGKCKILWGSIRGTLIAKGNVNIDRAKIHLYHDNSIVLDGNIRIESDGEDSHFISLNEGENIEIKGDVNLSNVTIKGSCRIEGEMNLENVSFKGDNIILGNVQIKPNVKFTGKNRISGGSLIPPDTHVHDVVMTGGILNYGVSTLVQGEENSVSLSPADFDRNSSELHEYIELIGQIEADYESYTTDIVKLIKYPAMVDASIPEVIDFVSKLRSAKRGLNSGNVERIKELAEALDTAFIRAENKVQTLVASHLDEGKKKSLKTAEKMFKLACDDASPEPEKRLGFKAGMRALEGILVVSDKATENMKERIGILELEA